MLSYLLGSVPGAARRKTAPQDYLLSVMIWIVGRLDAMIDAEGHTEDRFTRIAQNDGPVAGAITLAV
jgi:hypothetical protein